MENVNHTLTRESYSPSADFVRVAAATPEVSVGDVTTNIERVASLYDEAALQDTSLVVFPELSLTGYSIGDLVQSPGLLAEARHGLAVLAEATRDRNSAMVVGLPLAVGNAIYNCAALLADGEIQGIVPKQHLPTYKEFYEKRWYQTWDDRNNTTITIEGRPVTFGRDQLFAVAGSTVGIEICEDLWVTAPPHQRLMANGADIIVNPSASPEIVSKSDYRRRLIGMTASKYCVYVYSGADSSESTMDVVMSGHAIVNENGHQLAERRPFTRGQRLTYADADRSHVLFNRRQDTNYPNQGDITVTPTAVTAEQVDLRRSIDTRPFIPKGTPEQVAERLEEILAIQAIGLAERIRATGIRKVVLGLSGGLDSTLALMVAQKAADRLGIAPGQLIETITMPSHASSERTQSNAVKLAAALGIPNEEIAIGELADAQLAALSHTGDQDVTFENTQARIRTALLFNRANQNGGMVLGTGDLSEIALGWCTFGGDHLSHYNVNASIPKTLVRHLVRHASTQVGDDARVILEDILDTPVSPELTGDGTISQETENIIGPYELHDFFLYRFVRFMEPAGKISYLAQHAFKDTYTPDEINHWLGVFIGRFGRNQWKRSVMPDGPKVGTVSLSPRGDWRMPSDTANAMRRDLQLIGVVN